MANTLKCEMCGYHWKEEWEEYPSCHWVARAPGEEAPCEEEPYWDEDDDDVQGDEYDRNHCFPQEQEDELCMSAVYNDMLAYHRAEMF